MKKIGILTFHGAHNYGSVLQSYVSVMTLRKLGYQPEIINLRNQAQLDAYRIFQPGEGMVRRAFKLLLYPKLKSRFDKFEQFITHALPISAKEYRRGEELNPDSLGYDIYYTGSDQVWNPACQDFESAYYLDFVNHRCPTVAYAPSMGKAVFDTDDEKRIKQLLKYVDYLSCREQSGADLIARLSGRAVAHVCDPVLLPDKEEWSNFAEAPRRRNPYILAYFLNNNHGDRSQLDTLRKLTGYDIVILNEYIRDLFKHGVKMKINATPQEFLGLIRDAAIVYTNSFHATAFSVIFHKNFYTAVAANANVHNNNDSRKLDFLASLGLESRIVRNGTVIDSLWPVDYSEADKKLAAIRKKSLNYLKDALREE